MSPEPSPTKDDAVTIPVALIFLDVDISPIEILSVTPNITLPVLP